MVEITDQDSAQAWLKTQPHQVRVWFAARCALRALPGIGLARGETIDHLAFASFRAMLISGAAGACPAPEMGLLVETAAAASAAYSASAAAYSAASKDSDKVSEWPPLWHDAGMPEGLTEGWNKLRARMQADPDSWDFWLEWYEAILEGRPLPWDLSFRIATTLTLEDWDKGPAHVAKRIAEIRQAYDVASAVSDLRGSKETVAAEAMRTHRGHNNPPELIEEPALVEKTTVIWAALDDLEHEAQSLQPDTSKARRALTVITDWFVSVCAYLGRKVDLAIDTAIKWAIPAGGGGYFMLNPDKLQRVIDLAEIWLK